MKKRDFSPTMDGLRLEDRVVLSTVQAGVTASAAAIHASERAANDKIDYTLPFIRVPGVPQGWLNFTSHTFNQMIYGGPGQRGFSQILSRFNSSGNVAQLENDLAVLSHRVPYGHEDLLPTWLDDLNLALAGNTGGFVTTGPFSGRNGIVANQLVDDLVEYLENGVGDDFNVLLSSQHASTDIFLTYNGKVGPNNQRA